MVQPAFAARLVHESTAGRRRSPNPRTKRFSRKRPAATDAALGRSFRKPRPLCAAPDDPLLKALEDLKRSLATTVKLWAESTR
jgi:hypothetical protein